jgi:uncharacterized protein
VSSRSRTTSVVLALGVTTGLVTTGLVLPVAASAAPPTTPYISEIHYDNTGTDVDEFVEVQIPAGTDTDGLSVVLYNGGNGAVYDSDQLPAVTAPSDAPAVAVVDYPTNGIQNGAPDGLALVDGTDVVEFLSYEGVMTATGGPADGMESTDIGVAEVGSEPVGQSLQRTYDADADALVWSGPAPHSKGKVNVAGDGGEPDPEPGTDPCTLETTHDIGEVQGDDAATTLEGQQVVVRGTVVGDLPGFDGFHLQDDGDGDPATSDGIFVYSPGTEVDLGDEVAVRGQAGERFGQTQITSRDEAAVCAEGGAEDLPAPVALDLPATDPEREAVEGMLVAPVDTLTVSEVYDLTSFGELTLSEGGLLVQPTEVAEPGEPAQLVAEENALRRIVLDDGLSNRVSTTTRPYLSPETPVRVGDELTFTEPLVLGYGFDQWRLQPADGTAEGVFTPQNTRPTAPDPVGGDVKVAAFNVLNYFLTWSGGDARGARDAEQFAKQSAKIVTAIEALDADVVTLMEIEDTDATGYSPGDADQALADLVDKLNASAGAASWAYVPLPQELYAVERDAIRNGIIYRADAVETVGDPVGLVDESVWFNAREPIAQTFDVDGDAFTVVANHFKSKSPGNPSGDNVDSGDGQGAWNGDRTRQAVSLAGFAEDLAEDTGDEDVLLVGDFNAYSQEDPIDALRQAGFSDLGTALDPGRYSYVFDDQSGSLDHALASESLSEKVTGLAHWNINAVESFAYQYYGDPALYADHAYRSSDHDPLVLGLDLEAPTDPEPEPEPKAFCKGVPATIVGGPGRDVITGTKGDDVIVARGGNDRIDAGRGDDLVCSGGGNDRVHGGRGRDVIYGQAGNDRLFGGPGKDRLFGGKGNDRLRP